MTLQLPALPKYAKGSHPDDLLSEGSALETRAVVRAAQRFLGGQRVEVYGPVLPFAVRSATGGYLHVDAATHRVRCDGLDPTRAEALFYFQKGGVCPAQPLARPEV